MLGLHPVNTLNTKIKYNKIMKNEKLVNSRYSIVSAEYKLMEDLEAARRKLNTLVIDRGFADEKVHQLSQEMDVKIVAFERNRAG